MPLHALYDLPAPAKLNLFLHVIGRRADGYHLLQSIFSLIDWQDTLQLERRDDGLIHRHDLGPALPADDLCLRAARALQQASGSSQGVDISIDKQVPWGAGLGGGSSDAATVLLGLNRLWDLRWPRERLLALGATLGADVPFFIGGHTAFVEGIGEILTPIELPLHWWAVLKPAASIPTPKIFSSELVTRDTNAATVAGLLAELHRQRDTQQQTPKATSLAEPKLPTFWGRNDLQAAAEALCPEVQQAARQLAERFGNSRMTGSGSAVFADAGLIAAGDTGAGNPPVATMLEGPWPDGWVGRMCRSLPEHPLVGWVN
ncbi:4-(cytidine 5'-diphospho)-2-C-methyl-D-erythritol kinase [Ideonella sp. B7]|uniref:4-(cytidine 5'-diphospho)-2-C-methyl-D-erythritol kinase n=1 Tax=Ideonella benzenivorans TaxID=2831643 RepID=UPI001CED42D9|nr:4-(cytidine 5'-diphospho)-2-C-methyl-D-erythritol kinase [Ideonella benzenivorans]MCA6217105.1 4-(cytidine 5'-diphospho)-2-C-methyl-D-erythritol kinase [Ideonella benzenivorans]